MQHNCFRVLFSLLVCSAVLWFYLQKLVLSLSQTALGKRCKGSNKPISRDFLVQYLWRTCLEFFCFVVVVFLPFFYSAGRSVHWKMICLYLNTLTIGYNVCSMLSILNGITLQRICKSSWQTMGFGPRK